MLTKLIAENSNRGLVEFQAAVATFNLTIHGSAVQLLAQKVDPDGQREKCFDAVAKVVQGLYERRLLPKITDPTFKEAATTLIQDGLMTKFDKGTPEYIALRELAIQRNKLVRAIIKHLIQTDSPHLGLSPLERSEYLALMDIQNHTDDWLVEFTTRLHDGTPTSKNKWTVFRNIDGVLKEITFGDAYPQVREIGKLFDRLANRIARLKDEEVDPELRASKVSFYRAYAALCLSTQPEETTALILEAEKRFAKQGGRVIVVPPIETAYAGDGSRINPEAAIAIHLSEDPASAQYLEIVERLRANMIKTFEIDLTGQSALGDAVKDTFRRFRDYKPGFYQVLSSGIGSIRLFAGKSIPNDAEAVLEAGRYILFNPGVLALRLARVKEQFRRFFGAKIADSLLAEVTLERFLCEFAGGHEIGHAFAKVLGMHPRITYESYGLIEEWKASAVMYAERYLRWEQEKETDIEPLRWRIVVEVIEYFRNCERRNQDGAPPYYIGNRSNLALMQELGILRQNAEAEGGWDFNFEEGKVRQFFGEITKRLYELAAIYESGTTEQIGEFIAKYNLDSEFDAEIQEWYSAAA